MATTTTAKGLGYAWRQLCKRARTMYPPVCHLCGHGIDLTLRGPHPWSWSLDHLDARMHHGAALPDITRVRPSHFGCNARKGAGQAVVRSQVW